MLPFFLLHFCLCFVSYSSLSVFSSFIFIPLSPLILFSYVIIVCFFLFSLVLSFLHFHPFLCLNLFLMSSFFRHFLPLSRFLFPPIPIFFSSYCLILLYRPSCSLFSISFVSFVTFFLSYFSRSLFTTFSYCMFIFCIFLSFCPPLPFFSLVRIQHL